MSIRIGSRLFAPRWLTTLITLALLALLCALGRWQLQRAAEKQLLFDAFAKGSGASTQVDAHTPPVRRYGHVSATGRYDGSRQVLVDNMVKDERAGYYVITPFELAGGGWLLVNRGWVGVGNSRSVLPKIPVGAETLTIHGRADNLPLPGIKLGRGAPLAPPYPLVADFPTHAEIAALLKESVWATAAEVVLLDDAEPFGFARRWSAPGFPPIRHIGYAVQWFGLALALIVIYFVTNLKRVA